MTVFGTDMLMITFVIIMTQIFVLFYQIIHCISRPSDKSRQLFLLLVLTYIIYNVCSGLLPDDQYEISMIIQTIIAHLSGFIFATYFIYYIYQEYDVKPLRLFTLKNVAILIFGIFIPFFVILLIITQNIKLSRTIYMPVTLAFTLLYGYQILKEINKIGPSSNYIQKLYKMRKVSVYAAVISFLGLPIIVMIGDYQYLEQPIVNFGFYCLTYSHIKTGIYQSLREYEYIQSIGNKGEIQQIDLSLKLTELNLTSNQITIAKLILEGHSYKTIAENIFIADGTVRKHASNIFKKAGVASKKEFLLLFQ